jgi:RNA polymerase sigma-70 factor (ECF subfamily)
MESGMAGNSEGAVNELVSKAQAGSMEAFDGLVRSFQRPVFNMALRMLNSEADAADVTQEIFVRVYKSIGSYAGRSKFSTWLFTLAVNTCRSGMRRLGRVRRVEGSSLDAETETDEGSVRREPVDPADPPGRVLERKEILGIVQVLLPSLRDKFREVVV